MWILKELPSHEHNFQTKQIPWSDNSDNFCFGGMERDLLNVVFNSRSPTSSLCCKTHLSLSVTLTSRTDLKSLFQTKMLSIFEHALPEE